MNGLVFGMGVLVTLIVAIGLGLPIYGAILDGRDDDEAKRRLAEVRELLEKQPGRRPAA